MAASKLVIRQVRSANGSNQKQRGTLRTLGLGRIGKVAERPDDENVRGQLARVSHLVEISDG
jgi:large subunit ribosomal protein L30